MTNPLSLSLSRKRGLKVFGTVFAALALLVMGGFLISQNVQNVQAAPATFSFADNFDRTVGQPVGNGWTSEGLAPVPYNIVAGGKASVSADAPAAYHNSRLMRPATEAHLNQTVSVDVGRVGNLGILLRDHSAADANLTAYLVYVTGSSGLNISRSTNGSIAGLASQSFTTSSSDTYRLTVSATGANPTTICATFYNVTTGVTIVDNLCKVDNAPNIPTVHQSAGRVGFYALYDEVTFDNFTYTSDDPSSMTTYTVQAADLWDNGYNLTSDNPRSSSFSRFIFNTTADEVTVSMKTAGGWQAPMAVYVDGVKQTSISAASNVLTLGSAGTEKRVEIVTGGNASTTPYGNYLTTIQYDDDYDFYVIEPETATERVVIFGDSITVGNGNADAPNSAITPRLRAMGYSVMAEGSSGDTLARWNQGSATAPDFTNLVNRFANYSPETIWIEMGHNDGSNLVSAWTDINNFGNAYAKLVDDLHAALPDAHIICQGMMRTEGNQRIVGDKILEVCNDPARKVYAASIDAQGWVPGYGTAGTNMADATHPNDAGNVFYATKADEVLKTLNPTMSLTGGDNNYTEGSATSDLKFTVPDSSVDTDIKLFNRVVSVKVDGTELDEANYSLAEGSVVVTLSQNYLNSLTAGTHTLAVSFTGNIKVSSQFNVLAKNTGGTNGGPDAPGVPNTGLSGLNEGIMPYLFAAVALAGVLVLRKLLLRQKQ